MGFGEKTKIRCEASVEVFLGLYFQRNKSRERFFIIM